jgi:hypothetical protein
VGRRRIKISSLVPFERGQRTIAAEALEGLKASIRESTERIPGWDPDDGYRLETTVTLNRNGNRIIGGHQRLRSLTEMGQDWIHPDDVTWIDVEPGSRLEELHFINLNNQQIAGDWTFEHIPMIEDLMLEIPDLTAELRFEDLKLEIADLTGLRLEPITEEEATRSLAERFLVPPFTVLDARQGYWQLRKRAWISLGISSEEGRGEDLTFHTPEWAKQAGSVMDTSVFDPVLCELAYRWFCPPGGTVLDPFAGGSVRGIVASKLGRRYIGVDLRPEQVEANRAQAEQLHGDIPPVWHVGDSQDIRELTGAVEADLVFSCPPYADLEVYSDDARDLSTMEYPEFIRIYRRIIGACVAQLRDDRFACFVVGEVRDKAGHYRGFVPDTIKAFEDAGARFYNEAILVTQAGTLPFRVAKQFEVARKLGKTHQNVLVFVKGDARRATAVVGPVEFKDELEPDTE